MSSVLPRTCNTTQRLDIFVKVCREVDVHRTITLRDYEHLPARERLHRDEWSGLARTRPSSVGSRLARASTSVSCASLCSSCSASASSFFSSRMLRKLFDHRGHAQREGREEDLWGREAGTGGGPLGYCMSGAALEACSRLSPCACVVAVSCVDQCCG